MGQDALIETFSEFYMREDGLRMENSPEGALVVNLGNCYPVGPPKLLHVSPRRMSRKRLYQFDTCFGSLWSKCFCGRTRY